MIVFKQQIQQFAKPNQIFYLPEKAELSPSENKGREFRNRDHSSTEKDTGR